MRQPPGNKREERVLVLYSQEEFDRLKVLFCHSLCKTIANYVRTTSLQQPVSIVHRNISFDSFLDEVIELRQELSEIRKLPFTESRADRLIKLQEEIKS